MSTFGPCGEIVIDGVGVPQLAPDLTYPADRLVSNVQYEQISGIDASSGLTSIVSGTGKFLILLLETDLTTAETNTAKLTVNGVVVWNDSFTASTASNTFIGSTGSAVTAIQEQYIVTESFDFEYQTTADTSIDLKFLIRPIL